MPTPRTDAEARMVVAAEPFPIGRIAMEPYEAVTADTCRQLERALTAAESRASRAEEDAERLEWCEKQWTSGLHIETCGESPGGNAEPRKTATVYLGSHQYKAPTVRQAIDFARGKER